MGESRRNTSSRMVAARLGPGTVVAFENLRPLELNKDILEEDFFMLNWAFTFLIVALIAAVFGLSGVAGTATHIAWVLFVVFLILFLVGFVTGRRIPPA